MQFTTHKAGILRNLLKNHDHIEPWNRDTGIYVRHFISQFFLILGRECSGRMINFPQWHSSLLSLLWMVVAELHVFDILLLLPPLVLLALACTVNPGDCLIRGNLLVPGNCFFPQTRMASKIGSRPFPFLVRRYS